MGNINWDTRINLQQLIVAVITVVASVMLFGFGLKGQVDMSNMKQQEIENRQKTIETKLDGIQTTLFQIQLDLKDKADREDG